MRLVIHEILSISYFALFLEMADDGHFGMVHLRKIEMAFLEGLSNNIVLNSFRDT